MSQHKSAKQIADKLDAEDRLRKRGYVKKTCPKCNGLGIRIVQMWYGYNCGHCKGQGHTWEAPIICTR